MANSSFNTEEKKSVRKAIYTQQRFIFMTLDPVHIGTGGYRLGRVDMTITREPGTNIPKIPGTSLSGAARSYAAMRYGKPDVAGQQNDFKRKKTDGTNTGTCPIIYTFGMSAEQGQADRENRAGTVSIGDARLLFFPVTSMAGPLWVTTAEVIQETWGRESVHLPQEPDDDTLITSLNWNNELNLGWLMFGTVPGLEITPPVTIAKWPAIKGRIALVTPRLFSQIINSNLEVRTSVSINPETGAAESGALFTYEAIPRATWLWCDVIEDDYRADFHATHRQCKIEPGSNDKSKVHYLDNQGEELGETWSRPLDVVRAGVNLIEYLGVGGMGTRGFGRVRRLADWTISGGAM